MRSREPAPTLRYLLGVAAGAGEEAAGAAVLVLSLEEDVLEAEPPSLDEPELSFLDSEAFGLALP